MTVWHEIHDFVRGWGLQERIPDNEIVVENYASDAFPFRVTRSKQPERYMWGSDVHRLLQRPLFEVPPEERDALYDQLQVALAAEVTHCPIAEPMTFTKLSIPRIEDGKGAMLDIRQALAENPIREQLR